MKNSRNARLAHIEYEGNSILYNIDVPIVSKSKFEQCYLEPLATNGIEVKIEFQNVLMNEKQTLAIISSSRNQTFSPAQIKDISDDKCIPNLLQNSVGDCVYKNVNVKK